jgi:hypothetical protein
VLTGKLSLSCGEQLKLAGEKPMMRQKMVQNSDKMIAKTFCFFATKSFSVASYLLEQNFLREAQYES